MLETINKAIVIATQLADQCSQTIIQNNVPSDTVGELELAVGSLEKILSEFPSSVRDREQDLIQLQQSVGLAIATAEAWLTRASSELTQQVSQDRVRRAYRLTSENSP